MKHRTRLLLSSLFLLLVLVGVPVLPAWRAVRQARLDQALRTAVKENDTLAVVALLAQGANPNARDTGPPLSFWTLLKRRLGIMSPARSAVDFPGITALMYASQRSSPGMVRALLNGGADVNAHDEYGRTALMFATGEETQTGSLETIRALLAKGANVNQPDEAGETPLMMAAWDYRPDVVKLLLTNGAKVNASATETGTVLYSLDQEGLTEKATADEVQRRERVLTLLKRAGAEE